MVTLYQCLHCSCPCFQGRPNKVLRDNGALGLQLPLKLFRKKQFINRQREWKTHVGNVSNEESGWRACGNSLRCSYNIFVSLKWFLEKRKVIILSWYLITRFKESSQNAYRIFQESERALAGKQKTWFCRCLGHLVRVTSPLPLRVLRVLVLCLSLPKALLSPQGSGQL